MLIAGGLSTGPALAPGAQVSCVCGDYNCTGTITSADILEITRGLYQLANSGSCVPEECRDTDGDGMITDRDVVWVTRAVYDKVAVHCDSVAPPFALQPTDDFFLLHETVFPAGDSIVLIHIDMVHYRPIAGFSVSFLIKVDGVVATFGAEDGFP